MAGGKASGLLVPALPGQPAGGAPQYLLYQVSLQGDPGYVLVNHCFHTGSKYGLNEQCMLTAQGAGPWADVKPSVTLLVKTPLHII